VLQKELYVSHKESTLWGAEINILNEMFETEIHSDYIKL
jgi:hypothetical protein